MTASGAMGQDPEVAEMMRRLRYELEQELLELEQEAERLEGKQSDLSGVAIMAMMAGERWHLDYCAGSFDGYVVHAGSDFLGLSDSMGNLVDVRFDAVQLIRLLGVDPSAGRAPTTLRPASFRGRLLGLQEARAVEIGGTEVVVSGTVDSVNVDHVSIDERSGNRVILPTESIGFVMRRPGDSRRQGR